MKANSKDAHFADALISDLLSLNTQIKHEPTLSYIPMSDVVETYKGDTFEINITKRGEAIYHVYGGYTIIADPRMIGLYQTIEWLMDSYNKDNEQGQEDLEDLELNRSAIAFVLSAPTYAFSNDELTFKIAKDIVEYLNSLQEKMLVADVVDEDFKANIEFENTQKIARENL